MSTQQRKDKYFGVHEFQAREEVVKTSSARGFGLMFGVAFGLIAGYCAYRGRTLSPYWLAASGVLATAALTVPRVLAARVQTVHAATNLLFQELLERFYALTGCPVLVNTSFNVRIEPIVCSPEDAFRCFMGTEIEMLVCGSAVLRKQNRDPR